MFKDSTKTIQTNRLILRKSTITDADDMYNNWASDIECYKYLAWNVHKNWVFQTMKFSWQKV